MGGGGGGWGWEGRELAEAVVVAPNAGSESFKAALNSGDRDRLGSFPGKTVYLKLRGLGVSKDFKLCRRAQLVKIGWKLVNLRTINI